MNERKPLLFICMGTPNHWICVGAMVAKIDGNILQNRIKFASKLILTECDVDYQHEHPFQLL